MDAGRFDGLARSLARLRTRRSTLRYAGALAAFGAAGSGVVEAKRHRKKKCKHHKTPCGKTCCARGKICAGNQCVVGKANCPSGADSCATNIVPCTENADCECHRRLEGGTRCVQFLTGLGACDQCETDTDCIALGLPKGSSCIQDFGPYCTFCQDDNKGYCGEPCGFVPPTVDAAQRARNAGPNG